MECWDRLTFYKDARGTWHWRYQDGLSNQVTMSSLCGYEYRRECIDDAEGFLGVDLMHTPDVNVYLVKR